MQADDGADGPASGVLVRRIRSTEGGRFRAIRLRAVADSPGAFGSTLAEIEARPTQYFHDRAAAGAEGEESVLFVAEESGDWIGLVGGFLGESEGERCADLISMWVSPSYRGRGIGRRLVERLVGWARERGARRVILWVTETNAAAIGLYARCGFVPTSATQPLPSDPHLLEREMVLTL